MDEADLEKIKADYEAGMSYRAIALKHGCGKSAPGQWAKQFGWTRNRLDVRTLTDMSADSADSISVEEIDLSAPHTMVSRLAVRLLDRVGEALNDPRAINARDLRSLASTLLDVRQILNAVSPLEAEEQRLRIEGLRRQIEQAGSGTEPVTVRFVDTEGAEI